MTLAAHTPAPFTTSSAPVPASEFDPAKWATQACTHIPHLYEDWSRYLEVEINAGEETITLEVTETMNGIGVSIAPCDDLDPAWIIDAAPVIAQVAAKVQEINAPAPEPLAYSPYAKHPATAEYIEFLKWKGVRFTHTGHTPTTGMDVYTNQHFTIIGEIHNHPDGGVTVECPGNGEYEPLIALYVGFTQDIAARACPTHPGCRFYDVAATRQTLQRLHLQPAHPGLHAFTPLPPAPEQDAHQ